MNRFTTFDIWSQPNPVARIDNLVKELNNLSTTIQNEVCEEIVKKIVIEGGYKAMEYNAQAPQSNAQRSTIRATLIDKTRGEIALEGPGAVYDEFGTGERGADDAHPLKGFYPLNPYNSGPFVSTHINKSGRHFWFSPNWTSDPYVYSNGYTEGIPSGKQMYNTLQYVRKIKDNIVNEEINKATKTLR